MKFDTNVSFSGSTGEKVGLVKTTEVEVKGVEVVCVNNLTNNV